MRNQALKNLGREPRPDAEADARYYALSNDHEGIKRMCLEAGFTSDIRLWYQPCNWYYKDGADYWDGMKSRIPAEMHDDAIRNEMIRLFEETKPEMRTFEKLMILVHKQ